MPFLVTLLAGYPDPFLVKQGAVWVLRPHEKAPCLCSAPLLAESFGFYDDELDEVYATGLISQTEIDAIIVALTPAPPEGDEHPPLALPGAAAPEPPAAGSSGSAGAPAQRSEQEIRDLFDCWKLDPSWDLETTEGFEAHYERLRALSQQQKALWGSERQDRLEKKAVALGVPGNVALAGAVLDLEYRLKRLEDAAANC